MEALQTKTELCKSQMSNVKSEVLHVLLGESKHWVCSVHSSHEFCHVSACQPVCFFSVSVGASVCSACICHAHLQFICALFVCARNQWMLSMFWIAVNIFCDCQLADPPVHWDRGFRHQNFKLEQKSAALVFQHFCLWVFFNVQGNLQHNAIWHHWGAAGDVMLMWHVLLTFLSAKWKHLTLLSKCSEKSSQNGVEFSQSALAVHKTICISWMLQQTDQFWEALLPFSCHANFELLSHPKCKNICPWEPALQQQRCMSNGCLQVFLLQGTDWVCQESFLSAFSVQHTHTQLPSGPSTPPTDSVGVVAWGNLWTFRATPDPRPFQT